MNLDTGPEMLGADISLYFPAVQDFKILPEEKELFEFLFTPIRASPHLKNVSLRVAGGWVRDRILGVISKDLDIVVYGMTASEYTDLLCKYFDSNPTTIPWKKAGMIKSNPDAGKHQQVMPMFINGIDVDFAQLEPLPKKYESSISEKIVSPVFVSSAELSIARSDAFRRDFTVNSMFYSLNHNRVEDLTGKGISDLRQKILRAPLSNGHTFEYDPLRMLRGIRFAAKYSLRIETETETFLRNENLKKQFAEKIAKPRIQSEIEKICKLYQKETPNNYKIEKVIFGFELLSAFDFVSICFFLPAEFSAMGFWNRERSEKAVSLMKRFGPRFEKHFLGNGFILNENEQTGGIPKWALILTTFLSVIISEKFPLRKNHLIALTRFHIRDEWKFTSKISDRICDLLEGAVSIAEMVKSEANLTRVKLGTLLRSLKSFWKISFLLAENVFSEKSENCEPFLSSVPFQTFLDSIEKFRLLSPKPIYELQHLIKPEDLKKHLAIELGSDIGKALEQQMNWQLENPNGDAEMCLQYLKANFKPSHKNK